MLLGYGRVSKGEGQDNTLQVEALQQAGCARIFSEIASAGGGTGPNCIGCLISCGLMMWSSSGNLTVCPGPSKTCS